MGDQQLKSLSDLDILNENIFDVVLPAVLESLTCNMDEFRDEYTEAEYDELLGWQVFFLFSNV